MTLHDNTAPAREALLQVRGLRTMIGTGADAFPAVTDVSFEVHRGEILGIVGESGSGKTLTALSVVQMLPGAASVTEGTVTFDGIDMVNCPPARMRQLRGKRIGMIFQDPLAYLNPRMTVGAQLAECCTVHGMSSSAAAARAEELLGLVGIDEPASRLKDYPHQFSGGMRQRVLIAMAMANQPDLLIADEPTTALDVTVQAEILDLLVELRDRLGVAIIIITHDMSIVRQICDTTMVMYAGRIAERGPSGGVDGEPGVLTAPRHPYSSALLQSVPSMGGPRHTRLRTIPGTPPDLREMPSGCAFAPRCAFAQDDCLVSPPELVELAPRQVAACLHPVSGADALAPGEARAPVEAIDSDPVLVVDGVTLRYPGRTGRLYRSERPALADVSLQVGRGELIGVIGESGSGKSTLARAMLGLVQPQQGTVTVNGVSWKAASGRQNAEMRRAVQMVFQDPYLSLNPRHLIRDILAEPLRVHRVGTRDDREERLGHLMDVVGLRRALLDRYPYQLSGGQRQRVGIARALAVEPSVIVADEPVSALDVSVQAQVVNLLGDLRADLGVGIVFIAHDLGLVRQCTDSTYVMYRGEIVEHGPSGSLFDHPQHPYTQRLIASASEESVRSA